MKQIIPGLALVTIGYFIFSHIIHKSDRAGVQSSEIQFETVPLDPPLNVVAYQDGTASITRNGVELIHSSVFLPYCYAISRDIQLSFGIIDSLSSRKLITLQLPAARFKKPIKPDMENVGFEATSRLKAKYDRVYQKYQLDSTTYFSKRQRVFTTFCQQVDSSIAPYRVKLSRSTDLVVVIPIADKIFNFSFAGNSTNYLLLITDGLDSYNRYPGKLKNKAEIILINANGNASTDIDSVVNKKLQSTEQAIEFTLSTHN